MKNCLGYTKAAIHSIKTRHKYQVYVIDDQSDQDTKDWIKNEKEIKGFIDPPNSTGLAYNWNLGIKEAIKDKCTHFLVANNDILFHPETIDNLVERINEGDAVMVTGVNVVGMCERPEKIYELKISEPFNESEHPDFSCFMITERTIKLIGWFDDRYIGAYFEDQNYHARIVMLGHKAISYTKAPYYHYASQTLKDNPRWGDIIQEKFRHNQTLFGEQFGKLPLGDPDRMRGGYFPFPYNDPTKNYKDM